MKVFLLTPISSWKPWYDKCSGLVIAAESAQRAREIANLYHGDEGEVWTNEDLITCEELHPVEEGLILRDYQAG